MEENKKHLSITIPERNECGYTDYYITGNKLYIIQEFATEYDFIEPLFPGDDRDKIITSTKTKRLVFILPENHKQELDFNGDVKIKYEVKNGEFHLVKIDATYHSELKKISECSGSFNAETLKYMNDYIDAMDEFDKKMSLPMNNLLKNQILGSWKNENVEYIFLKENRVDIYKKNTSRISNKFDKYYQETYKYHIAENMLGLKDGKEYEHKINEFQERLKINYITDTELSIQDILEEDGEVFDLQILQKVKN